MGYKICTDAPHPCLECGDEIVYGRTDKIYCSEQCRRRHNNRINNARKNMKLKIMGHLEKNYGILARLLEEGVDSIGLPELEDLGYDMKYSTSYRKIGGRNEYRCFDIRFYRTPSRIMKLEYVGSAVKVKP